MVSMENIDEIITVSTEESVKTARFLAKEYGLLTGISSGANFAAAKKISKRYKNIVTVFPDRAERYLSTALLSNNE